MKGNAFKPENQKGIKAAKVILEAAKQTKLNQRASRYENVTADFQDLFEHLTSEVQEIIEAYQTETKMEVIKEIADASNCLDLLAFEILTNGQNRVIKTPGLVQAQNAEGKFTS